MTKIAIVGATGPTGIHLVAEFRKTAAAVRVKARTLVATERACSLLRPFRVKVASCGKSGDVSLRPAANRFPRVRSCGGLIRSSTVTNTSIAGLCAERC
jgi:hypothetical protein